MSSVGGIEANFPLKTKPLANQQHRWTLIHQATLACINGESHIRSLSRLTDRAALYAPLVVFKRISSILFEASSISCSLTLRSIMRRR